MANIVQKFNIVVWFTLDKSPTSKRDFERHDIDAENLQEAVNKAYSIFAKREVFPFYYLHKGVIQEPTNKVSHENQI